jgi:hypothetical protein
MVDLTVLNNAELILAFAGYDLSESHFIPSVNAFWVVSDRRRLEDIEQHFGSSLEDENSQ